MKNEQEMIIMCGIPKSGKSTYVNKYYSNHQLMCADDIRLALGTQFEEKLEKFVWAIHDAMLESAILRRRNIIIDSTNVTINLINKYIQCAKKNNYNFKIIVMDTLPTTCIKRNTGKDAVPEIVIASMYDRFEDLINCSEFMMYSEFTIFVREKIT